LSLTAWRIVKLKYAKSAFDGSGARKHSGRWNSPGTAIVYTSQSQSLAVLEMLVHLDGPAVLQSYVLIPVEITKALVRDVSIPDLPQNWRAFLAPQSLKQIGDDWARAAPSVALKVPSALLPMESNFLLNPNHSDFKKLVIGEPVLFALDERLKK
jgi:RES domain-containing protein